MTTMGLLALDALAGTGNPWPGAEAAMPLLALVAGLAGAWLHIAHPPSSPQEQDMALAALRMP